MSVRPGNLHLNRERARWLGVCAGIADWLDIPATLVRIVFIICVLSWPPLIIGYFLLYICLDKEFTPDRMRGYFANAKTAEHFRQLNYRKPIYKNTRNKRIAGVCAGIADYLEVSAFSVRIVTLIALFLFGPFTFWAYIICMFVFEADPHAEMSDRARRRAARREARRQRRRERHARWHRETPSAEQTTSEYQQDLAEEIDELVDEEPAQNKTRKYSRAECTRLFSDLELRLREIEAYITSKRFRLHCEINRI